MSTAEFTTLAVLLLLMIGLVLVGMARAAGKRKPHDTPQLKRRFYYCAQRGCPARATRIVMMVTAPTEARVVCEQDGQRLVRLGHAVDLGPVETGR